MVPMNCNRGGSFNDESFGSARAAALQAFREIFGPDTPEFQEFSEHLKFDWGIDGDVSSSTLYERFLETGIQAIRPQDKVAWFFRLSSCFSVTSYCHKSLLFFKRLTSKKYRLEPR